MELTQISLDVTDHVATVIMDNPPVNAASRRLQEELTWCFDQFNDRDDVRVVVLSGKGKVFCAGADLKAKAEQTAEPGQEWANKRTWRECTYAIMECRKPVIAALNGPALGAGLAIAASCDILLASTTAEFGLPEINVGLLGGARRAMRLFGHSKVRRMVYCGTRVGAADLERWGIVEAVLPPDELMAAAAGIAAEIAAKSPIAIRLAKRAVNTIEEMSVRDGYRFEQDMTAELGQYEDSKEAMKAFVEKRPPRFVGR